MLGDTARQGIASYSELLSPFPSFPFPVHLNLGRTQIRNCCTVQLVLDAKTYLLSLNGNDKYTSTQYNDRLSLE